MTPIRTFGLAAAITAAAVSLAACEKQIEAPTDVGVCYAVAVLPQGKLKFNKVAVGQPRIENCEVELEKVRLNFVRLGDSGREIMGAYQGSYIWVSREGVFVAETLKGHRYPSLFRDDNGRLVIPGAQPATPAAQ
jgi:hypothetical protein